jgi:xanthine dehydrogenase YagR molybdenum-binding subunit
MGVAINTWGGGGRGPSGAHIEIASDGLVVVRCGTQDLGTGTRTLVAVVAADTLGVPVSAIRPEIGDTMYPISGGSGGSTTAAAITNAVRNAIGVTVRSLPLTPARILQVMAQQRA